MPAFPPVFLQAEAAAMAAGQRQLWLLLQPGAQDWHWQGPALLLVQAHPLCHSMDTWVSDPIQQCQDCLSQNVWGWESAPMAQRTAVSECWRGLSEAVSQSMKTLTVFLYPQILLNGCVSHVAFLFDQHPSLFCY